MCGRSCDGSTSGCDGNVSDDVGCMDDEDGSVSCGEANEDDDEGRGGASLEELDSFHTGGKSSNPGDSA